MSHAKLSPSGSKAWMACPGSLALIASLPEDQRDTMNIHSARGTAAHEGLANCLEDNHSPAPLLGKSIAVDGWPEPITLDAEDVEAIQVAYNYVRQRQQELGADCRMLVEEKLNPGENFHSCLLDPEDWPPGTTPECTPAPRDDCWGTADVVLLGGGELEVIDYKHGTSFVDERENPQMLLYLLGALKHATPGQVQRIRLTIIQPRCRVLKAGYVRSWELPEAQCIEWAVRFGHAAARTDDPNAPRIPGEEQCRWCPAKAVCPEVSGAAVGALTTGLSPAVPQQSPSGELVTPESLDGDLLEALTRTPDTLTPEQRAKVLDMEPLIRSWLKAVSDFALREALRGRGTPGFKVVNGRRSRSWKLDTEELLKKLGNVNRIGDNGKAAGKLQKDVYTTVSVVSPAQAEKVIKPRVTPKTWSNIEGYIEMGEGKPTLAPASDSRSEISGKTSEEIFGLSEQSGQLPDFMN